jgi:glutamine amidotransferase
MFHLALSFGLENDVPAAIAEMVRVVEAAGKENGVAESLWMTLGISNGESLWGFRYGSNGVGPTLYVSPDMSDLRRLNPALTDKISGFAACIVSEPIGNYQESWKSIPDNSSILIQHQKIEISSFNPKE